MLKLYYQLTSSQSLHTSESLFSLSFVIIIHSFSIINYRDYGTIDVANYTDIDCDSSNYQTLFQCDLQRNGCDPEEAVTIQCCK